MTVILISEECHGFIGIAKDFESARDYLFAHNWIDDGLEIWDENECEWRRLDNIYGKDWKAKIYNMDRDEFEMIFSCCFILDDCDVYGT